MRCVPGSLIFAGVPCSSHIWISRGSTGKSRTEPLGDEFLGWVYTCTNAAYMHAYKYPRSVPAVKLGNKIAARWGLGALIGIIRQCIWAAEQPSSSVLPFMVFAQRLLNINLAGFGYPPGQLVRLHLGSIYAHVATWRAAGHMH